LATAVNSLPNKVIDGHINLPGPLAKKVNKLLNRFYALKLLWHEKIQEIAGEMGTALVLKSMGFELSPLSIDAIRGPDQVAQHKKTGVRGIFEAKGGYAKLGTEASYGKQMGGEWISYWLRIIINKNRGTNYGRNVKSAFDSKAPMLATLIRLNMQDKKGEVTYAVQKYTPQNGNGMKDWPTEWYR
jgi:hypothetical protein